MIGKYSPVKPWISLAKNDILDHQTIYLGIKNTEIKFQANTSSWNLDVIAGKYGTKAAAKSSHVSFLLGRNSWHIEKDSRDCNSGDPYSAILKLTGCREDEFTCSDGQCRPMAERCDQLVDCRDECRKPSWFHSEGNTIFLPFQIKEMNFRWKRGGNRLFMNLPIRWH